MVTLIKQEIEICNFVKLNIINFVLKSVQNIKHM